MSSAICFNLDLSKILLSGNRLNLSKVLLINRGTCKTRPGNHRSIFDTISTESQGLVATILLQEAMLLLDINRLFSAKKGLTLYHTISTFNDPKEGGFSKQHFPKIFSVLSETNFQFLSHIYFVVCKSCQFGPV